MEKKERRISLLREKRGEGYVDICIGALVFAALAVFALGLFAFLGERTAMDAYADRLAEVCAFEGRVPSDLTERVPPPKESYEVEAGADDYFDEAAGTVQLGETLWVRVTYTGRLEGVFGFGIPVTVSVERKALSERYWK